MANDRKRRRQRPPRKGKRAASTGPSGWNVAKSDAGGWALVAPKSVADRQEDLDEVRAMIDGGEPEIAADELRWLLADCPDHMTAHALLGELAAAENDLQLARAHFGYAFQIGEKTLIATGCPGPVPGADPRNAAWHDAALGLAWALEKQSESRMADDVSAKATRMDPADPAGIRAMLDELRSGGLPMATLGL